MRNKERIRAGKLLIRRILLEDWDPIGIGDNPGAQNEYDSYLGGVYKLLARDASIQEIVWHLHEIERVSMGLQPKEQRLTAAAEKLKSLRPSVEPGRAAVVSTPD